MDIVSKAGQPWEIEMMSRSCSAGGVGRLHPHLIADEVRVTWALHIEDVTPRTANILAQDAPRTLIKVSPASSGSCHQGQLVPALVLGLPDHPGAVEDDLLSSSPSFF